MSNNDYDWLGHGIYFWENNPSRALEYARMIKNHPERVRAPISKPAVVGAVIDLGKCLNLLEGESIEIVRQGYVSLIEIQSAAGIELPENSHYEGGTPVIRKLDCAVIEVIHEYREARKEPPFDSVRAMFTEGPELYPNSGFMEKNHIQICVRNPNCIKGYFLPQKQVTGYPVPQ